MAIAEGSILNDTKKVLNIAEGDTAFDTDVIMHINSALSTLNQLGVGPTGGLTVEGVDEKWGDLAVPGTWLGHIRTYMFLKVKLLFDPPGTSFHIEALERQITEHEARISGFREELAHPYVPPEPTPVEEEPVWG